MALIFKQLYKQTIKDKVFLLLLLLLTSLTSLSFFFVKFSIDGNMETLKALDTLTENQQLYKNALSANTTLACTFWLSCAGLSALVFVMFFYRFFRGNKMQIGCIKALGFSNCVLQFFFVCFTAILSVFGALLGLAGGYFLSDILIDANTQTYGVSGLSKGISGFSLTIGLVVSTATFCFIAVLCYGFVRNKEAAFLLAGNHMQDRFSATQKIADKISKVAPENKRLSLRVALRKPLSVLLLFAAVMSFSVCVVLGQSLNISSTKVFSAQTEGHNYAYDIRYLEYQTADIPNHAMAYIDSTAVFTVDRYMLERTITGLYDVNELYALQNKNGRLLTAPKSGTVYIHPEFSEIYGVEIGDALRVNIAGEAHTFTVEEIAVNAKSKNIYMNGKQLAEILDVPTGSYNGVLSAQALVGDKITSKAQRIEKLNQNAVSNKTSAVINQATGVLAGAILIFLALHINFQDNTRDILILHMLGHPIKSIQKLLVDVYLPILWTAFAITLAPGIALARKIQNSLSISTDDYMPFGMHILVVMIAFVLINAIYWCVQTAFRLGIKSVIAKGKITDIIYP